MAISLPHLFKALSDWIVGLPEWQQNVIVTLIAAFLLGFVPTVQWLVKKVRDRKARLRELAAAKDAEEARVRDAIDSDFASQPAELGDIDHGVNTTATLETIQVELKRSLPPLMAIMEHLFSETVKKLPLDGNIPKKQALLKQAAREIHPHVLTLESISSEIRPQSAAFIAAYRALLNRGREISDVERDSLESLKKTYSGGVAETFKTCADLLNARRADLLKLDGKQQDLSRMIRRSARAIKEIHQSVGSVARFCSGEMARSIDRLISPSKK